MISPEIISYFLSKISSLIHDWQKPNNEAAAQLRDQTDRLNDPESNQGRRSETTAPTKSFTGSHSGSLPSQGVRIRSGEQNTTPGQEQGQTDEEEEDNFRLSTRSRDSITCVVYSLDGRKRAVAACGVQIWDVESGHAIGYPLEGHATFVLRLLFSPDGTKLASASHDGMVRLWDVETGQAIGSALVGHTSMVYHLMFSPDGNKLASISYEETVLLWDTSSGQVIQSFKRSRQRSLSSCFLGRWKKISTALI